MKDAQKPDHVSLNGLLNRLKEGRFVIPDFQREFEWEPWDISYLMRSIFLDYYIGNLLLWKSKKENVEALSCEQIYGFEGQPHPEHIVLDGQQRLTAIYYAFLAPNVSLPRRMKPAIYYIKIDKFMSGEYDNSFHYDFVSKRTYKLMNNRDSQYSQHFFPLSIIGSDGWDLPNWLQGYVNYWNNEYEKANNMNNNLDAEIAKNHANNGNEFSNILKDITQFYQISYIELDRDIEIDKVCDIFTQINSRGIRLDAFDLINALLKPKGLQLKHMWRSVASRLEFIAAKRANVYLLQVMSIMLQAYCSPKYLYYLIPGQEKQIRHSDGSRDTEILIDDSNTFISKWNEAVDALDNSIKLICHPQEYGVISLKFLPYISILPPFSALHKYITTLPNQKQFDAQRKLRHWYWASVFTVRYSGAVESTSARDYLDIRAWIDGGNKPTVINDFNKLFTSSDNALDLKRAQSGSSIYIGIFNLLIIQGARDWITGKVPQYDDVDDHHIVPKSWGLKNLKENTIDSILNRTPLSSDTNRNVIKDRLPNQYLKEMIENNGENVVRDILESHFISRKSMDILLKNPFTEEDYNEFILEREKTILKEIKSLLVEERLDMSPNNRILDEKIESIELELRKLIIKQLDNNLKNLPQSVLQSANNKIKRAEKKKVTFDIEYYSSLEGILEYCDLREIHDIIMSKLIWPFFIDIFHNKETFSSKFDQLAELRNGIRHSRTVDEIILMEGEAAIIWFDKILK